jgi:hypothetical protein
MIVLEIVLKAAQSHCRTHLKWEIVLGIGRKVEN